METFPALLAICAGNSPATGEFHAQRPVTQSFDVFFDLHLNKRLSKNGEAGDLRRHRANYDVNVMFWHVLIFNGCLIAAAGWSVNLEMEYSNFSIETKYGAQPLQYLNAHNEQSSICMCIIRRSIFRDNYTRDQGSLLATWINFNPCMDR